MALSRIPFQQTKHTHNLWDKSCPKCHSHRCNNCGLSVWCSNPNCPKDPLGASLVMSMKDCFYCVNGKYLECKDCATIYDPKAFSKCFMCNWDEMLPFWEKAWTPGRIRVCRCNRCGG